MRGSFLSRLAYQTFNGYVLSQFKKLEQDLRAKGEVRWKHVMHMIRLLLSGISLLREGELPVSVTAHRDRLLAIRAGAEPWDKIETWRHQLHGELDTAYRETCLPARPDYDAVNRFLIKARQSARELACPAGSAAFTDSILASHSIAVPSLDPVRILRPEGSRGIIVSLSAGCA